VLSYEYTPFGDTLSTSAGETARIGFIGQEQDIEHGYFNMGARYYDPEIGRFLSVDPLFEMYTEYTPYNYCNNSPMMFRDPSGLSSEMELVGEFEGYYHYILNQIDVTAEKSPDDNYWYNIPRLGGGGGSSAIGVNKMGYSSLISGIMNNNAPLHSFFYFNFAESGEMNGNARGIGNTGSANGKSNSSNGGGSGSAGIPKEARLDYEAEETEYIPNLSNYYNGSNALSFFPADNTSTCTNCLFGISSAKDFQIFFDLAGIIHPAGDVLSAGISFENGDYVDGLLSLAAIIPIAGDMAKYGGKIGKGLTKSQIKSIKSFEEQIKIHTKKLNDYKMDPFRFDNKNFLKNAPNEDIRNRIYNNRIRKLEIEIDLYKQNIDKILKGK
jgi:RHS repeat-associated protein